jgi:hypothetical protein
MKTLRDLKVGDMVFVIQQVGRNQKESDRRRATHTISKVGRDYGYFTSTYNHEYKFSLDTGHSYHKEGNERANGFGFDVYLTESAYEQELFEKEEFKRLVKRLRTTFGVIKTLPHEVVEGFHKILDTHNIGENS